MTKKVLHSRRKTSPVVIENYDIAEDVNPKQKDEDSILFENPERCLTYIQDLRDELSKEQMEKEALSLERDKLKVCWEMMMEQLADVREDLMCKIETLQKELTKQVQRKKLLQKLLQEHGKTIQELKGIAEQFFEKNNNLALGN